MFDNPANDLLRRAVASGELAAVEAALDEGADPNTTDQWYRNPLLHLAVWKGNPEIVRALLTRGADPNGGTQEGTLLNTALSNQHTDIAVLLIDAGTTVTWANVEAAVSHQSLTLIRLMLAAYPDVNATDKIGATFLMSASFVGAVPIIRLLLDQGADVQARTVHGWTALMSAAAKGHKDAVSVLINAGADINAQDKDGDTALKLAQEAGYQSVVDLLRASGAWE